MRNIPTGVFPSHRLLWCTVLILSLFFSGCGQRSGHRGGVPGSRPYTVLGQTYTPLKSASGFEEVGVASWYGSEFHGRKTSSGEVYNQYAMTAAHKILPFFTRVQVENLENGRTTEVVINDRGPFVRSRVIDLSKAAAEKLGVVGRGTARVRIRPVGEVPDITPDSDVMGDFYIQVGAYRASENADKAVAALRARGLEARKFLGRTSLWQVQAGPWPDSCRAEQALSELQKSSPDAFVVGGEA